MTDNDFYDCAEVGKWDKFSRHLNLKPANNFRWIFNPFNIEFFESIGVQIIDASRIDGSPIIRVDTDKQFNKITRYFEIQSIDINDHAPKLFGALMYSAITKHYKLKGFKNKDSRRLLERKEKLNKIKQNANRS
jgi:hypothetical protein